MDAVSDPLVEKVVIMKSAQTGGTEVIMNTIGYKIHLDPGPILAVQPTVELARAWSKERLAPMIRDTDILRGLVKEVRSRDSSNTLQQKKFPGGMIAIMGANAPSGLASRPIRDVFLDEVDRFPASAGTEGDPVKLASKRTQTFYNSKIIVVSTPTIKGLSRIEVDFDESDQKYYHVPCPVCGQFQILEWSGIHWDKIGGEHRPDTVYYECKFCSARLTETDKYRMIRNGKWIAERPEVKKISGFHISELYSPWSTWENMIESFLEAKVRPELLQVFVNTALGQVWEESGVTVDDGTLLSRREAYGPAIPEKVIILTAGVDVQHDRIECVIKGWGRSEESWLIDHRTFMGDISQNPKVLIELDDFLLRNWPHESGKTLRLSAVGVDSGYHTKIVYDYCRHKGLRRVFPIKGGAGHGRPIIGRPTMSKKYKVQLFVVGVDSAKELIYSRLKIDEPGRPGILQADVR
jgi:phage terminase large subunit GpA-like protein